MEILNAIKFGVQFILDMGTQVMLPFMILILGLVFRMKFSDALKSGINIGVGFVGIFLMVDLLVKGYEPIRTYYSSVGANYTVTNIGWSGIAAMAWAVPISLFIVPLGFILNYILLRLKVTKTLNVDVWNYYSCILAGAIAYYMFLNLNTGDTVASIAGILVGLLCSVLVCLVGDRIAPRWQEYFDLPEGVTCTTFDTLFTHYPLCWLGAWIYDHIPGLNKIRIDAKKLEASKIGSWGSIPVLTFVISVFLLVITHNDLKTILSSSMTITASVILMPKCVSLLMEGLVPVSNAARKWASDHLKIDGMLVGMDVSIGLGDPNGMTTTLALLPITIALAFIIPGVNFIPIGLFGGMIWTGHAAAYMGKGNLLKSIFAGTFICAVSLVALTIMAPICTRLAFDSGVITNMSTLVTGGNIGDLPNLLIGGIGKLLGAF